MSKIDAITSIAVKPLSQQGSVRKTIGWLGQKLPDSFTKYTELANSGALQRVTFFMTAMFFVLGVRYFKSRDEHERREVLTRDGITIGAAVFAVPFFKKYMCTISDKITGIPTTIGNKVKEAVPFSLLEKAYINVQEFPEKLLTFCQNTAEKGGNLTKVFKVLGKDADESLKVLLQGKENTSKNILEAVKAAHKATENFTKENKGLKEAASKIMNILEKEDNALIKRANHLKAIPDLASIVLATSVLGWGIPAFNIWYTGKKIKDKHHQKEAVTIQPKTITSDPSKSFANFMQNTAKANS